MKSAFLTGLKAFVSQVRENTFEMIKKSVEKRGYEVVPKQPKASK